MKRKKPIAVLWSERNGLKGLSAKKVAQTGPIRLRLLGGRELVLPASMSDQRVAALVGLIEDRGSIIGGGGRL